MEQPSKILSLAHKNFVKENERYVEIYKLTSETSGKSYIGQAVSHILNNKKYRRYGMEKRFLCHVSEAFSNKKNQCGYLNNAIKKYGAEDFKLELLELCSIQDSEKIETKYIIEHKTMFPGGYNLKLGTHTTFLSEEGRKRVSDGVVRFFQDKKYKRFENVTFKKEEDLNQYIKPLSRYGKQYGWYVYIQRKKADFGGVHIDLNLSRQRAYDFLVEIRDQYMAKHQDAETALESSDTTFILKGTKGTRLKAVPNGNKSEELADPQART
jgi:hypothetical protein